MCSDDQRLNRLSAMVVSHLPEDNDEAKRVLLLALQMINLSAVPAAATGRCSLCLRAIRRAVGVN